MLFASSPPLPASPHLATPPPLHARQAEAELPSTPLASYAAVGTIPKEVLAAAVGPGRLCLITCVANGNFLTLEPGKDWVQCAGDASTTPLHEGLFVQELRANDQLAFRHVRTGKYLQVVAVGQPDAWVVRAHTDTAGASELFEIRGGRGGNSFLYHVGTGAHVNRRFGAVVRAHGETPGQPAGRIPAARMSFTFYSVDQLRSEYAAAAAKQREAREPVRLQLSRIHALAATGEVRVISYGLYGDNTRYTIGVLRNAELAPLVYPGWKVRVYLDKTVPKPVVAELEALGAQLRWMDGSAMGGGIGGMFWRFLVAADPEVRPLHHLLAYLRAYLSSSSPLTPGWDCYVTYLLTCVLTYLPHHR